MLLALHKPQFKMLQEMQDEPTNEYPETQVWHEVDPLQTLQFVTQVAEQALLPRV